MWSCGFFTTGKQIVPVEAETVTNGGRQLKGRLQLIDNQVNTRSGTVRVRAVFDNKDGSLIPGQFVKLRMGKAKTEQALLVSERAIGTDQNKRFVIVVGPDDKAIWREVTLGGTANGPAHRHLRPRVRRAHRGQRPAARAARGRSSRRRRPSELLEVLHRPADLRRRAFGPDPARRARSRSACCRSRNTPRSRRRRSWCARATRARARR